MAQPIIPRAVRNMARSPIRSALVTLMLGVVVAVFLTLAQAAQAVADRTEGIAASFLNLVEVRAAGATGMGVGVDALPEEFFEPVDQIEGVARVEPYLLQRTADPSKPVTISIFVGVRPADTLRVASHGEVGGPRVVSGRALMPEDTGRGVAVIGATYADLYDLSVGDVLTLEPGRFLLSDRPNPDVTIDPLNVEVVGVFESGFTFGDAQVFLPLDVAQHAFRQEGRVTNVFVTAESADKVAQVEQDLRRVFGDRADVISGQGTLQRFTSTLDRIRDTSLIGAGVALVVAALVILLTMALVAAERQTEVGVLKALGATSRDVVAQFLAETAAMALLGAAMGFGLYWVFGSTLGTTLVGRAAAEIPTMTGFEESPLTAIGVELGGSALAVALTVGAILLLTAVGNLIPTMRAVRLSPAEAIRDG